MSKQPVTADGFSSLDGSKILFKCVADGDSFVCFGEDFVDLQESDNYAFGDTWQDAVDKFIAKQPATIEQCRRSLMAAAIDVRFCVSSLASRRLAADAAGKTEIRATKLVQIWAAASLIAATQSHLTAASNFKAALDAELADIDQIAQES